MARLTYTAEPKYNGEAEIPADREAGETGGSMKNIQVVAAVICQDGRVLATRRGYGGYRGYWEFPGGKIEAGETPEEALEREIREELAIRIAVEAPVGSVEYDYPEFHLSMQCFRCTIVSGEPKLKEHEDARWLAPAELDSVGWLPADRLILPEIRAGMTEEGRITG